MRSIYHVFVYLQWTTWYVVPSSSEIWIWSVESFEIKVTFSFSNDVVTDSATPELISRFYAFSNIHKTPTWATARCIIFLTIINCRTDMNGLKNVNLNDLHDKDFVIAWGTISIPLDQFYQQNFDRVYPKLPFFFVGIYRPVSFERRPDLTIRWNNPISTLSLHLFSSSISKSDSLQPPKIPLYIDFLFGTILQNGRNGHWRMDVSLTLSKE